MTTPPEPGNLFAAIPADIPQEIFTDLVQAGHVTIKRIVSRGQASPVTGWYDQDEHEWVLVLAGAADIAFGNGDPVRLEKGSYLNIPAHTRHRVAWTSPDTETIWLAVHYS